MIQLMFYQGIVLLKHLRNTLCYARVQSLNTIYSPYFYPKEFYFSDIFYLYWVKPTLILCDLDLQISLTFIWPWTSYDIELHINSDFLK